MGWQVSEHQPTTWTSFFFDLHICVPFAPVGLYFLFQRPTDGGIFLILYGTISWYFAGACVCLSRTCSLCVCGFVCLQLCVWCETSSLNSLRFLPHLCCGICFVHVCCGRPQA